jgi:thiosulfate/3-mercaptopyruvate sulfurtransferase
MPRPLRSLVVATLLALPLLAASAAAQSSSSRLVTPDRASALIAAGGVVVLQVGTPATFTAGHLPGARPVALADISTTREETALFLELPSDAKLEAWARSVGLTDASRILVVPANDTIQSATRVLFTLEVMGFGDRVAFLNGGFLAWQAAGLPVETGEAAPLSASAGPLTVRRDSAHVAVIAEVAAEMGDGGTALIDARLPQFYRGQGGGYPRPGHIPTAVNVPLNTVTGEYGAFKDTDALRALFTAAGVEPGQSVITYCHIGQQASVLWFAARELGHPTRLFDGSFQQWSGSDRPLVSPPPSSDR